MRLDDASRQNIYSGTKEVANAHAFDVKKLEAYLADRIEGFQTSLDVRQFKGGQSSPTYQLVTPNSAGSRSRKWQQTRHGKSMPVLLVTLDPPPGMRGVGRNALFDVSERQVEIARPRAAAGPVAAV